MSEHIDDHHSLEVAYAKGREDGRAESAAKISTLLPLARFGLKMFEMHRAEIGDIPAEDATEAAELFGLLIVERRTEHCRGDCRCAFFMMNSWRESWDCYKSAPCMDEARAIIDAAMKEGK